MVGYWVVDDVGTVINPMLVKGQIMGGIAQGMGQVLMEDKCYDEAGQVLTGSFMDYAMPRADDFCAVVIEDNPVPTPTNPLGVKGAGEAGTVGSLSAGVNADRRCSVGAWHQAHRHAVHAVSGVAGDCELRCARHQAEHSLESAHLSLDGASTAAPSSDFWSPLIEVERTERVHRGNTCF